MLVITLSLLTWRFLQLHLYKIAMIFLFATSINQISVFYWVLLVGVITLVPLSSLRQWTLPLVTLYLGAVSLSKMVYQIPLIQEEQLDFSGGSGYCDPVSVSLYLVCNSEIVVCALSLDFSDLGDVNN